MRVRSHLTIPQYADLIGDVWPSMTAHKRRLALERLRRRCQKNGLAEPTPGMERQLRVSTERIRELERDVYERLRREARFWEDGCPHPIKKVELAAPGLKWCGGCGALNRGDGWRLPLSQQLEEM
jgi:hypothetical protein